MCPVHIEDFIELARHKAFLAEHEKEFPFPVDGSDWSRLVSTRRSHEHHVQYDAHLNPDFWYWVHSERGPIRHERRAFQRALHHWFLIGSDSYNLPWVEDQTRRELALQAISDFVKEKNKKNLSEFETDWITGSSAAKVWRPKASQHWLAEDSENFEVRSTAKRKYIDADLELDSEPDLLTETKDGYIPPPMLGDEPDEAR